MYLLLVYYMSLQLKKRQKWSYQQDLVMACEDLVEDVGDQGKKRESIQPVLGQSILTQRCALVPYGKPHVAVNRL